MSTTNQHQSGGDKSSNLQAARDIVFNIGRNRLLWIIVGLVIVAVIVLALFQFNVIKWPLLWRSVVSSDLADVIIDRERKYQQARIDPTNPADAYVADGINQEFTETYTKAGGRVVWTGIVESANAGSRYVRLRLDDAGKAKTEAAFGGDKLQAIEKQAVVGCTFPKDSFNETITPGKVITVTGRVEMFQRQSIILKSCEVVPTKTGQLK